MVQWCFDSIWVYLHIECVYEQRKRVLLGVGHLPLLVPEYPVFVMYHTSSSGKKIDSL